MMTRTLESLFFRREMFGKEVLLKSCIRPSTGALVRFVVRAWEGLKAGAVGSFVLLAASSSTSIVTWVNRFISSRCDCLNHVCE